MKEGRDMWSVRCGLEGGRWGGRTVSQRKKLERKNEGKGPRP